MVSAELVKAIRVEAEKDQEKLITPQGWRASGPESSFDAFFARDAAICSKFRLHLFQRSPDRLDLLAPVKNSLITMADHQGKVTDPETEQEFGKILHELRYPDSPLNIDWLAGLARNGWPVKDRLLYFGASDTTPLFVDAACEYYLLTGDEAFFRRLHENIRDALYWMWQTGNRAGEGFIRYAAENRHALLNQVWKDSSDSIEVGGGVRPKEPIAPVEVQGYAYGAYVKAQEAFRRIGEVDYARDLAQRAGILKTAFNEQFWMADEGFFAFVLDGANNQVNEITSNPGHLLLFDIVDEGKLPRLVERLMKPDILTRWGIRTLSSNSIFFSDKEPSAYHNGSIWPHDNVLIYLGLMRHGYAKEAKRLRDAILSAQYVLGKQHSVWDYELFIVDCNGKLRPYDRAAHPQSWVNEANNLLTDPEEIKELLAA